MGLNLMTLAPAQVSAIAGTVNYNGFAFPLARNLSLTGKIEEDEAGWARTHTLWTLEVHCFLCSQSLGTGSAGIQALRCLLSAPAGVLTLTGIGWGDTIISGTSPTPELKWGPKPRLIKLEPVGGLIAWELHWVCDFAIIECCGSTIPLGGIMAANTEDIYSIDDRGLLSRTISGYVEIANTRPAADVQEITVTADSKWDAVNIPVPTDFKRVNESRKLSKDKRRLDFSVTDQELETDDCLPPGIVRGNLDYSIENTEPMNFQMWIASFSATYERAKGQARSTSFGRFFVIVASFLQKLSLMNTGKSVIPYTLQISESKHARTSSMEASFQVCARAKDILAGSGLWDPVPGTSYAAWRSSMQNVWGGKRGVSKLAHDASKDMIIDLCEGGYLQAASTGGGVSVPSSTRFNSIYSKPPPDKSYLHYDNTIKYRSARRHAYQSTSQAFQPNSSPAVLTTDQPGLANLMNAATSIQEAAMIGDIASGGSQDDTIQFQGKPRKTFVLIGKAVRVGYQPTVPNMVSAGGVPVVEVDRQVYGPVALGSIGEEPIIGMAWQVEYAMSRTPPAQAQLPVEPNPLI